MYRVKCRFRTDEGVLDAGIVSEKELKKHFSKDELSGYIEDGLVEKIEADGTPEDEGFDIEALLDADKHSLKYDELKEVCKHYGIAAKGKKDDLIASIEEFEALLDAGSDDLEGDELKAVAAYLGVDTSLDEDAMREAIDALEA